MPYEGRRRVEETIPEDIRGEHKGSLGADRVGHRRFNAGAIEAAAVGTLPEWPLRRARLDEGPQAAFRARNWLGGTRCPLGRHLARRSNPSGSGRHRPRPRWLAIHPTKATCVRDIRYFPDRTRTGSCRLRPLICSQPGFRVIFCASVPVEYGNVRLVPHAGVYAAIVIALSGEEGGGGVAGIVLGHEVVHEFGELIREPVVKGNGIGACITIDTQYVRLGVRDRPDRRQGSPVMSCLLGLIGKVVARVDVIDREASASFTGRYVHSTSATYAYAGRGGLTLKHRFIGQMDQLALIIFAPLAIRRRAQDFCEQVERRSNGEVVGPIEEVIITPWRDIPALEHIRKRGDIVEIRIERVPDLEEWSVHSIVHKGY